MLRIGFSNDDAYGTESEWLDSDDDEQDRLNVSLESDDSGL
jgi:hypothetical protein